MPSITNANSRQVQFTPDGEGIDLTDMINMQKFQRQHEWVLLAGRALSNGAGEPSDPGVMPTPESYVAINELGFPTSTYDGVAYAPVPGAAYVSAGGANQLIIQAGPIIVLVDEPWNTGEDFALFHIPSFLTLATSVGDATNPRIDIVEVKCAYIDGDPQDRHFEDATTREPTTQSGTNKERQVEFSYQIKAGTPSATPAYPAPTAGYTAIAAVYVPATHNAAHSPANIRDLRMPLGIRAIDVDYKGMHFTGTNPWTTVGMLAAAGGSSDADADRVIIPCPVATKSSRLIAVGVQGYAGGGDPRCEIGYLTYPATGGAVTFTMLAELTAFPLFDDKLIVIDSVQLADAIAANAVIAGSRVSNSRVGTALWCNGRAGGMAHPGVSQLDGAEDNVTKLALSIGDAAGGRIGFVRFWLAEGV